MSMAMPTVSPGKEPPAIILTQMGVTFPAGTTIPEPALSRFLGQVEESERFAAFLDVVRLGVALKATSHMSQLSEEVGKAAEATVEKFRAQAEMTAQALASQVESLRGALEGLLQDNVAGDRSKLKAAVAEAVEALGKGLQDRVATLVNALDPARADSVGARIERNVVESVENYIARAVMPQVSEVAGAVQRLGQALADQSALQELKRRTTQKGGDYEASILEAVQLVLPMAYTERVGNVTAPDGTRNGDILVSYNGRPMVVFECRDKRDWDLDDLRKAMAARQAPVGVLVARNSTGPARDVPEGSVRILGDSQLLLVWDPDRDPPGVLAATVSLAYLLAQQVDSRAAGDVDLGKAQQHLTQLLALSDVADKALAHFAEIRKEAEKGSKVTEELSDRLVQEVRKVAQYLGVGI